MTNKQSDATNEMNETNGKIVKKAERQATEILVIRVITEVNAPLIGSYVDSVAPWQLPASHANCKTKKNK